MTLPPTTVERTFISLSLVSHSSLPGGALGGCVQRVTLDDDEVCEGAGGQDADAVLGEGGVRCRGGEPAEGLERREALSGVPARGESCESAF